MLIARLAVPVAALRGVGLAARRREARRDLGARGARVGGLLVVLLVSRRVAFVGVRLATVGLLLRVSLRGVPGLLVLVARRVAATVRDAVRGEGGGKGRAGGLGGGAVGRVAVVAGGLVAPECCASP